MTPAREIRHEFVEFIPDDLDEGVLYISIAYATTQHLCLCGCGHTVVTPLSPRRWRLTFDGETVSLSPSIGNWSFDCQSHYWIVRNQVRWAGQLSRKEIERVWAHARGETHLPEFVPGVPSLPSLPSAARPKEERISMSGRFRRLVRSVTRQRRAG